MLIFAFLPVLTASIGTPFDTIRTTLESYVAATTRYDVPTIDRFLATDYAEVSPLGEVDMRPKVLGSYDVPAGKRGPTPKSFKVEDLTVRFPCGDVAVAIFREVLTLGSPTQDRSISVRVTSVLHLQGGRWLLMSNHFTGIHSTPQPSQERL